MVARVVAASGSKAGLKKVGRQLWKVPPLSRKSILDGALQDGFKFASKVGCCQR